LKTASQRLFVLSLNTDRREGVCILNRHRRQPFKGIRGAIETDLLSQRLLAHCWKSDQSSLQTGALATALATANPRLLNCFDPKCAHPTRPPKSKNQRCRGHDIRQLSGKIIASLGLLIALLIQRHTCSSKIPYQINSKAFGQHTLKIRPHFAAEQYHLPRAQAAIDKNLAMIGCDQRAVPRAPAAQHGQAEHGT
jgi:hypothetical protein